MRKSLTILAACGLALGAAACGKHDDNGGGNVSASDNMLVPADENAADAGMSNDMGATDNTTGAMSNDMGAGTTGGATGAGAMGGGATGGSAMGAGAGGTGSGASSGGQ